VRQQVCYPTEEDCQQWIMFVAERLVGHASSAIGWGKRNPPAFLVDLLDKPM